MLDLLTSGGMRFCDRLSRREAMQIGGLGTLGLGLDALLRSKLHAASSTTPPSSTFGRAKHVILLFMWGGPAHQDTWDLKPDGPLESRGEFNPIETNVRGIHIGEHFPLIARHANKLAIIRSVGQEDNNHSTGAHAGLTGRRHELKAENFGASETDFPHFGSVLSRLRPSGAGLPSFVALPEVIATTAGSITPGQGGGLLGRRYDPFQISEHPDRPEFSVDSLKLPAGVLDARMLDRRALLAEVDRAARIAERAGAAQAMDSFYQRALDMIASPEARRAFDLSTLSDAERWRYGWHTFGQSVLLARRMIEAGVKLVTVYWHREDRSIDSTWDTHAVNFQELKLRLMPSVDRPIAALLEDLDARGLLDETLVIWNSEFGRTPRVNGNAGRDHWGPCNSVVMAGGGMPGGQVFGASDAAAAYPTRDKVTQDDIAATIYHLLGIDPHTLIHDQLNRPYPVALGQPIDKLLGNNSRPEPTAPALAVQAEQVGPFARMLRERGRRHLECDLGSPDGEKEWELAGWSAPEGTGASRHRRIGRNGASVKYLGKFYTHFAYSHLVLRFAQPHKLSDLTLSAAGKAIPVADALTPSVPKQVWQIPFPAGLTSSLATFELKIEGAEFPVTDIAIVGDPIDDRHLARVE